MEFTTRRCDVKKFIIEYIPVMYSAWGHDKETGNYLVDYNPDFSEEGFKKYIVNTYKPEYNDISVIQEKNTNEIIGYINLYKEDARSKSITFVIHKNVWNKGYAKEVIGKCVELLKAEGLGSLYATCDSHNIAAQHVLEATGFELIDNIPGGRVSLDGELGDEFLYEVEMIRVHYDT